jgi:hypothetical protein
LIIAGMASIIVQGAIAAENLASAMRTIASTIVMGCILVGLGAWKVATDRRIPATKRKEPAQK